MAGTPDAAGVATPRPARPGRRRHAASKRSSAAASTSRLVDEQHERGSRGARRGREARAQRASRARRAQRGLATTSRGAARAPQREAQAQRFGAEHDDQGGVAAGAAAPRRARAASSGRARWRTSCFGEPSRREPPAASTTHAIVAAISCCRRSSRCHYTQAVTQVRLGLAHSDDAPAIAGMSRQLIEHGLAWSWNEERVAALHAQPRLRRARGARPAPRSSASRSWSSTRSMRT